MRYGASPQFKLAPICGMEGAPAPTPPVITMSWSGMPANDRFRSLR